MKTPNDVKSDIFQLVRLLQEAAIAIYVNPLRSEFSSKGVERVTWASPKSVDPSLFLEEPASIQMYCAWLEAQAFSAILYDGSILQMSYDFKGAKLVGHRLMYFPCPFDIDTNLLTSEGLLDVVSLYRGNDNDVKLRTPLRFDYDPEAQKEGHPAAHFTMLWSHCRWAVVAPVSPGHFIQFVFRHFYPHLWEVHEFIRKWPTALGPRTISAEEERTLHISCCR